MDISLCLRKLGVQIGLLPSAACSLDVYISRTLSCTLLRKVASAAHKLSPGSYSSRRNHAARSSSSQRRGFLLIAAIPYDSSIPSPSETSAGNLPSLNIFSSFCTSANVFAFLTSASNFFFSVSVIFILLFPLAPLIVGAAL